MPLPMAPGVLGMARMMRACLPQAWARASIEVPAAMEIINAPACAKPVRVAASPLSTCGLIATTQTAGLRLTEEGASNRTIFFALAHLRNCADGLGSPTVTALTPRSSQPLSRADPIRPAPIRRMLTPRPSSLSGALQHRRRDGVFRALAAPQHELEGRVVMFAGFQRQVQQRLALGGTGFGIRENHGMAENDGSVL